ncbi:MAG: 50S ribosomal protein L2 [Thermoplasmata archaeon]|nr:50S ribosomal protein L2 [Thermoplasmata archaeon]
MGKRIIPQRRGHGSSVYRAPSHRYAGRPVNPKIREGRGYVVEIFHDPGHTAPLARVKFESGEEYLMIAHLGMYEGQEIQVGENAEIRPGNVLPLGSIPEGVPIYNIEARPGDGGKYIRSGGNYAQVVTHGVKTTVQMPSGEFKPFDPKCRATIGIIAGGGRKEKPMLKAGKIYHAWRSKARKHVRVRGVAMNAVNHPHGGGNHQHVGRPSTVSRHAPPGRKVGRLSPKKKKRKR